MPRSHLAPLCYECAPVVCSDLFFPMSVHLQSNWGGLLAGPPWYVQDAGARWGQGKEPRMTRMTRSSGNNFREELDLFVSRDMWR